MFWTIWFILLCLMVFNATFNNISLNIMVVSFIGGGPGENHRPVTSHWQTLSQFLLKNTFQIHFIDKLLHDVSSICSCCNYLANFILKLYVPAHGSWIYISLCNQCLSMLKLCVWFPPLAMHTCTTLCDSFPVNCGFKVPYMEQF
jgi:hypothetical protein